MTDKRIRLFGLDELQRQIFDALDHNPFLPLPIAEGTEVRVRDGDAWVRGVVREYRPTCQYAVELPDRSILIVARGELERDNPDAPRARRRG